MRRPARPLRFNGTALVEWQNVTAGYDLDALWNAEHADARRLRLDRRLRPAGRRRTSCAAGARPGTATLDVTGGGAYTADELSYDIFAQAGAGRPRPARVRLDGPAAGAHGAGHRRVAVRRPDDRLLRPRAAPGRAGVRRVRLHRRQRPHPGRRRAGVPGAVRDRRPHARAGRPTPTGSAAGRWPAAPLGLRRPGVPAPDLRSATSAPHPSTTCDRPPFSRVPMHHVTAAAYDHLVRWVRAGHAAADGRRRCAFNADGTKARDELGLALGGIRLSQVSVPTALQHRRQHRRSRSAACSAPTTRSTRPRSPSCTRPTPATSPGSSSPTCTTCSRATSTPTTPGPTCARRWPRTLDPGPRAAADRPAVGGARAAGLGTRRPPLRFRPSVTPHCLTTGRRNPTVVETGLPRGITALP